MGTRRAPNGRLSALRPGRVGRRPTAGHYTVSASTRRLADLFAEARALPGEAVAAALGLAPARERHKYGCPCCGSRNNLHAYADGLHCYGCRADTVDVAVSALGLRPVEAVRELLRGRIAEPFRIERTRRDGGNGKGRLPPEELEALWVGCAPLDLDAEVSAWVRSRGLDPGLVTDRDLARALPLGGLPRWARCQGRPWSEGWRCVIPMFDGHGRLAGLRARWSRPTAASGPKSVAPAGARVRGLLMACALGRQILESGGVPEWWDREEAGGALRVVIAEGEPDFLTWATRWNEAAAHAPAVLGVVAGSWCSELAARFQDGVRVIVRAHADAAGERYAGQVASDLAARCDVLRGGAHG